MERENERQIFHLILGLVALTLLLVYGRGAMLVAVFTIFIVGTLLINARLLGKRIWLVQMFEEQFERPEAPFPGWGSVCYVAGVLILLSFMQQVPQIAAGIFVLAVGDSLSTIVGRKGKIKLPYNKNKSLEGTFTFFIASLPAYFFVGPVAIVLAMMATIVESLPLPIDDNITVPIASVIVLGVM